MSSPLAELRFAAPSDSLVVAEVVGEIDGSNAGELRRAVGEQVPASASALVLDLSATSYVDSAGIELIFELARRLSARRQSLALVVPQGSGVRRVLELCDIGSVARLESTREQALDGT